MRITGGVGMHEGFLPGYPASHGCIRMPEFMAEAFFQQRRCRDAGGDHPLTKMTVPEISVSEADRWLKGPRPPRLIDVRELDEWEVCRIPGAELLPLSQWPTVVAEKLTDSGEAILLQCHHGGRSARAAEFLLRQGFTQVTNLAGGIDAWAQEIDPSIVRY